jgi:hypothetical protein
MFSDSIGGQGLIEGAIRRASERVGVDFDFLIRTAQRESALNPAARARTSSASGLFQFIESTWLATLHRHGADHGYGRLASLIERTPDGGYRVRDGARREVLDLRFDPQAASLMAAELASDSAAYLRGRIGRDPSSGELYAAHFLGPAGAARLIQAVETNPGQSGAALFPSAAAANRSIFYRDGRAATAQEVYQNLIRTAGEQPGITGPGTPDRPQLSERDLMIADAMDRLRQDRQILNMMMGDPASGSAFETQLLAAFAPPEEEGSSRQGDLFA